METILMSRKERRRLEAFSRVKMEGMTLVEAGELLRLSYRQTKRAWSRYQSEGDAGLVHRLRGRAPNRHSPQETKQRSLALYRQQYADYGATLAAECLEKEDGVKVSVTTLRRWLLQAGLLDRRRKRRQHRRRRTRREHLGELVQMCEPLDGVLRVFAGEWEVCWSPILNPPLPKPAKRSGPTGSSQGHKPAANHPWRG